MSHSDDDGLRLPPALAPAQVVIVPILRGDEAARVGEAAAALAAELRAQSFGGAPVRATVDGRDRGPADRRWEWVKKGVPLVVELGPRDLENGEVALRRRDLLEGKPQSVARGGFVGGVEQILTEIQGGYFDASAERLASRTAREITDLGDFKRWFEADEGDSTEGGFVRAPWSEAPESLAVLEGLKASVRCLPLDQALPDGARCVLTGEPAKVEAVFGKAY
jgi:prolyl-tRNA synthetase